MQIGTRKYGLFILTSKRNLEVPTCTYLLNPNGNGKKKLREIEWICHNLDLGT